jgi:hypothetical protein
MVTQKIGGGNTAEFYHKEGKVERGQNFATNGTLAKSQMQVAVHPDISTLVWKFKRWHHHVDYSGFKKHKLIRNSDVHIDSGVNNYGMELLQR